MPNSKAILKGFCLKTSPFPDLSEEEIGQISFGLRALQQVFI
jgi:hypothetical protein